jgi:hypothetical protein
MSLMHEKLIRHELAHAIVGLLSGLRVRKVWAPPPPDVAVAAAANPDAAAGCTEFEPGGDRRAKALAIAGGVLAEGRAPIFSIKPRTRDERQLATLFADACEVDYLELLRDAEAIMDSDEYDRMYQVTSELLAHAPFELSGEQLNDIRKVVGGERRKAGWERKATGGERQRRTFPATITVKSYGPGDDQEPPDTDCERDEFGLVSDAQIEHDIASILADRNGGAPAKSLSPRAQVEWKALAAAFDGTNPLDKAEQKLKDALLEASRPPVEVASFEC